MAIISTVLKSLAPISPEASSKQQGSGSIDRLLIKAEQHLKLSRSGFK
jgi:hypothetical protein